MFCRALSTRHLFHFMAERMMISTRGCHGGRNFWFSHRVNIFLNGGFGCHDVRSNAAAFDEGFFWGGPGRVEVRPLSRGSHGQMSYSKGEFVLPKPTAYGHARGTIMNILSLIQNQLSPQTIQQISNALGESPEGTKSALGTALPALLGSLLGKANSSPNGATDIFNMLKSGQSAGGWPESVNDAANGLNRGALPAAHQSLLTSLLGSRLGPVADFIASRFGIREGSATSLLGMAAPLLLGTLGRQMSSQGIGASGLGDLLRSQTPYLKEMLPSGLANTLGIGNVLSGASQKLESAGAAASQAANQTGQAAYQGAQSAYRTATAAAPKASSGILKWAWVPLVALAAWFVASRLHQNEPAVGGTVETNQVLTGRSYQAPDFSKLNFAPGSPGDTLSKAISSGDWNKSIDLPGFVTDSTGALADQAKAGVRDVASVLSAAPNVKVRIMARGETAEAGLEQASAIKSALVSAGVAEDRILVNGQTGSGVPSISLIR